MNDESLDQRKEETEADTIEEDTIEAESVEVESVDDYSSSNEAEIDAMEDDDVLEIMDLKTPFVDLTEQQAGLLI